MENQDKFSTFDRVLLAICLIVVLLCTFLMTSGRFLSADDTSNLAAVGEIERSENDVRQKHQTGFTWRGARHEDTVFEGDSIFTGDSSKAKIKFAGGGELEIDPKSLVVIRTRNGQLELDLLYGAFSGNLADGQKIILIKDGERTEFVGPAKITDSDIKKPSAQKLVKGINLNSPNNNTVYWNGDIDYSWTDIEEKSPYLLEFSGGPTFKKRIAEFEKDKIAYVFDSSLSVSKTKAARVRSELNSLVSVAQSIVLTYSRESQSLSESGQVFFDSEKKIDSLELYYPVDGKYVRTFEVNKLGEGQILPESPFNQTLITEAREKVFSIVKIPGERPLLRVALRFGKVEDPNHIFALVSFNATETSATFSETGNYTTFLLRGHSAQSIFAPSIQLADGQLWQPSEVWSAMSVKGVPEGIEELKSPTGQPYLVSFSTVGLDDLTVVALVDKKAALKAVNDLIVQAMLMLFVILGVTLFISIIASKKMTSALGRLVFATQKVSEGDFNVRIEVKSRDEFGTLAESFNTMAEEVSRLMLETAEKARMESELATAKAVQETLFPEANAKLGPVQITGHYTPASECGGDWWYYCEIGDRVYVWIGDATGHGAPAALLTSAVRAVVSVIQAGPPMSPSQSIGLLNRAIADSSKGKLMMTFFLGCIDKATGVMEYVNASHEPPLLLRKTEGAPSRSDFEALNDVNNPRLGEDGTTVYKQSSVKFEAGDQLVLYTDGVTDIKSPEAKQWGERKFLKSLSNGLFEKDNTEESLKIVIDELQQYRQGSPLDDDVTLILVQYGSRASDSKPSEDTVVEAA